MLDWDKHIAIADRFQHKAKRQDREDLTQDVFHAVLTTLHEIMHARCPHASIVTDSCLPVAYDVCSR